VTALQCRTMWRLICSALLCLEASNAWCDSSTPAAGAAAEWRSHGGGADESSYSQLDQIRTSNIGQLKLAWSINLPNEVTLEAAPVAVNDTLYFTGTYATVYAVDALTGKLRWKYDPQTWKHNPAKMHYIFAINRGVAYADGRIFSGTLDGRLLAFNARSGKLLWSTQTVPEQSFKTITGAPRTFNGKVIIGNAGADFGERGYVTAYDAATGRQRWRFYTTPGSPDENKGDAAMERAATTWTGEFWKSGTGGGVWDSITFDQRLNLIYLGTGNAAPYDPTLRSPGGGDNLYTASIVAVSADTGQYVWHYQINPRDSWDFDSTQQMTLADLVIDGHRREVLMQAPKNGFFYVLDRHTGKLISAEKVGKVTWAERIDLATGRPVEAENIRYEKGESVVWPGPIGGHNWQNMSFSPKTGLVYLPYVQFGASFSKGVAPPDTYSVGGLNIGWARTDPDDGKGFLIAWDPVLQMARWRVQLDSLWNGGTLATAGSLVFQGAGDGYFSAYDAFTGNRLWKFYAQMGILASPISYSVHGQQYVCVLAGYGGSAGGAGIRMNMGWKYRVHPRSLLAFSLNGKAALAPAPPPDRTVRAVDDPSLEIKPAEVAAGRALYPACAVCHGRDLASVGAPAPDLRESQLALKFDSFFAVVHDGALLEHGMPRFESLTREQVMQLHAYVRAGARLQTGASPPH
jgi:quinohemoprotein ethanol dehydrogenase